MLRIKKQNSEAFTSSEGFTKKPTLLKNRVGFIFNELMPTVFTDMFTNQIVGKHKFAGTV